MERTTERVAVVGANLAREAPEPRGAGALGPRDRRYRPAQGLRGHAPRAGSGDPDPAVHAAAVLRGAAAHLRGAAGPSTAQAGRTACPACGGTSTLGDLSREAAALRRQAGDPTGAGPMTPGLHGAALDVCAACGTLYSPWVRREVRRRLDELARLRPSP